MNQYSPGEASLFDIQPSRFVPYHMLLLVAYLATQMGVLWRSRFHLTEALTSTLWTVMMVVPFFVQRDTLPESAANVQMFGVLFTGFLLQVGDGLPVTGRVKDCESIERRGWFWGVILVVSALILQALHLWAMPKLPYLGHIFDWMGGSKELVAFRESASKQLNVPLLLKYAFQYSLNVFAPLGLYLLLRSKRYLLLSIFFLWSLFYSRLTFAKGPLVIFLVMCAMLLWIEVRPVWRTRVLKLSGAMAAIVFIGLTVFVSVDSYSPFRYKPTLNEVTIRPIVRDPDKNTAAFTYGDRVRVLYSQATLDGESFWKRRLLYIFHRLFFTPSDVAHRWYHYFPQIHGDYLGWYGLTPSTRSDPNFKHPANQIGVWAYQKRFTTYGSTAHAYASLDAESYARWGYWGIVVIGVFVLALRLALKFLRLPGAFGTGINNLSLFWLAVSLPMASIFAMLIAQGLAVYFLILAIINTYVYVESRHAKS